MLSNQEIININSVLAILYNGVNVAPLKQNEANILTYNSNEYQTTYDLLTSNSFKGRKDLNKIPLLKELATQNNITIIDNPAIQNQPINKFYTITSA